MDLNVKQTPLIETGQRKSAPTLAAALFRQSLAPTVSVVIPTLNEELNLPYVLPVVRDLVDEIILVDGHSKDRTVEVARQLCPEIRVVMQTGRGKGDALRAGFEAATSDIVVMLDADCSTDPLEIPAFVGALLSGADFVKGSRFMQGGGTADMTRIRRLGNWGFVMFVRLFFGCSYTDLCYGYNAFWRRVLPDLKLDCDGFEIETLMNIRALRAGLKVMEVPSFEFARVHGDGHLKAVPDGWRVLKTIFKEAFNHAAQAKTPADAAQPAQVVSQRVKWQLSPLAEEETVSTSPVERE